ncbi:MAG: hypothetical protein VZS44_11135 [Bacilli bacterium]|nr:hypothetical protein [Bacilli bacterium]
MAKYFRYILCGVCNPTDPLSDYRLIGNNQIGQSADMIRVEIPDNVELQKWSCDSYSTTDSKVRIKDLNPKVLIRINGKLHINEELTEEWLNGNIEPCDFCSWLADNKNYSIRTKFGYLTPEQNKWVSNNYSKIWQIDKIPKDLSTDIFTPNSQYAIKYKEYIADIKEFIKNHSEFDVLNDVSDVNIMNCLGIICFRYNYSKLATCNEIEQYIIDEFCQRIRTFSYINKVDSTYTIDEVFK